MSLGEQFDVEDIDGLDHACQRSMARDIAETNGHAANRGNLLDSRHRRFPYPPALMSPADTHPGALQRQVELLRAATPTRRFTTMRSLSRTVALLSRRALRRSMPDASQEELDIAFVALHYGDAAADVLRRSRARES